MKILSILFILFGLTFVAGTSAIQAPTLDKVAVDKRPPFNDEGPGDGDRGGNGGRGRAPRGLPG